MSNTHFNTLHKRRRKIPMEVHHVTPKKADPVPNFFLKIGKRQALRIAVHKRPTEEQRKAIIGRFRLQEIERQAQRERDAEKAVRRDRERNAQVTPEQKSVEADRVARADRLNERRAAHGF